MPVTNHVLLTRFNLPTQGLESFVRAQDGWLRDRVELFLRYCAPSVAEQQGPRWSWIVYFDPESPSWLRDRLRPLVEQGCFYPVYRPSVSTDELLADIREVVKRPGDHLLTTNLDNDDALATDALQRLAAVEPMQQRTAIYLRNGLIKSPQGLYRRVDPRNAFVAVLESWSEPVTCWSEYHNEFPRVMPVIELGGRPAWLQVVHGGNVSNRVRGRLVSPSPYCDSFPGLIDDIRVPRRAQLGRDWLVRQPARAVRDTARAALRRFVLAVLGKERYGDAKLRLAALRRPQ